MSLFGRLNDLLSGNPAGTADAQSALVDSANAQLAVKNQQTAANIGATQGDQAMQDYLALVGADYASQGNIDPNSLSSAAGEIGAGLSTLPDSVVHPIDTLNTGLAWEGAVAGSAVGSVAGGVKGGVTAFLKQIPVWVYVVVVLGVVLWLFVNFGGAGYLARKAKAKLAA